MDFDFAFRRRIRLRTKISFALKLYRYGFIPTTHAAFGLNRRRVAHGPSFSATALETVSWVSIAYNFYARPRRGQEAEGQVRQEGLAGQRQPGRGGLPADFELPAAF